MYDQQIHQLEDLCIKYVPSRHLGDMLPAKITMQTTISYSKYLSRLNDSEVQSHLKQLGVSKQRARDFVEQRNKI